MRQLFILLFVSLLAASVAEAEEKRLLILGDSITAGFGLSPESAYPNLLQQKLNEAGLGHWTVQNGGVSGDTTAGGLRRLPWLMKRPVDFLVIALGGNDALRGTAHTDTEANLQAMIDLAREENPDIGILLAGMEISDNMGKAYVEQFAAVFPAVAERNDVPLLPFLLEGVAGDLEMNQPDIIHPNEKGQAVIAELMWQYLEQELQDNSP